MRSQWPKNLRVNHELQSSTVAMANPLRSVKGQRERSEVLRLREVKMVVPLMKKFVKKRIKTHWR